MVMRDRESRTVLLVDGSASILLYLAMLLQRLEYRVVTARNAEEALQMMEDSLPTIVLTELSLSSMSGIMFLKRMKDHPRLKDIPVVILASEIDPGMQEACSRMGCAAYLVKPVEPSVLFRTIQSISESIPREHIRLSTSLKVVVGDGSPIGGSRRTEYATALSEGGLYVRTLYPQPRNTLTPVQFFLKDRDIVAKAVVLYSCNLGEGPFKEPGMGMKFVEISDSCREVIKEFIKEQLVSDLALPG